MSRTQQALAWLRDNPQATPYQAAKRFDLATSVLYRAIKADSKERCPCCGQLLRT